MKNPNDEMGMRSGEVIPARSDYPLLENQAAMAKALRLIDENLGGQKFSVLSMSRIKVPSGGDTEFKIETASGVERRRSLQGVITAYRQSRVYWSRPFGSGKGKQPPDCTSIDGFTGVGNPGGVCADCPFSQFGTARLPDGSMGGGQACKELRQLLILLPGQMLPHMLNIPPTSIQNFMKYTLNLTSDGKVYWEVTTKLTLEPAISSGGVDYARINFTLLSQLKPNQTATIEPYHDRMRGFLQPLVVDSTAYELVEAPEAGAPPEAPEHPETEETNPDQIPF